MQEKLKQHIEKTVRLTDDEYAFALTHFTLQNAKKREFLFQKGDSVRYAYFVVSGLLTLVYNDESRKKHIVSFAMEDW